MTARRLVLVLVLLVPAVLAGCASPSEAPAPAVESPAARSPAQPQATPSQQPAPSIETMRLPVGGSSAAIDGFKLAAERFMVLQPATEVTVLLGLGSSGGVKSLRAGDIDVVVTSRPLKAAEIAEGNVVAYPYMTEAIVLFAHAEAGVSSVSLQQLVDIYQGRVANWAEVGGNDLPLHLVTRERDDSETKAVLEYWPALDVEWGADVRYVDTDVKKLDYVRQNPGAVAFLNAIQAGLAGLDVVPIEVEGVKFSAEAVQDGSYPLLMNFHIATRPDPSPTAAAFRDYLLGPEWQAALEDALHHGN